MKTNTNTALWALVGSILIAALPVFLQPIVPLDGLFVRPPIFHLSLTMLSVVLLNSDILYRFLLPLPFLLTLFWLGKKPFYAKFTLFSVLLFTILNVVYFLTAVAGAYVPANAYGMKVVVLENVTGFALALVAAIGAVIGKSRNAAHFANLTLCMTLTWFAFPYFGGYP